LPLQDELWVQGKAICRQKRIEGGRLKLDPDYSYSLDGLPAWKLVNSLMQEPGI
jgi:hypothetical protein